jgi:hypothetical protein
MKMSARKSSVELAPRSAWNWAASSGPYREAVTVMSVWLQAKVVTGREA